MAVLLLHGSSKTNPVVCSSAVLRNRRHCVMLLYSPGDHAYLLHADLRGCSSSDQKDDSYGPRQPKEISSLQRTQSRKNSWRGDRCFRYLLGPVLRLESCLCSVQKLLTHTPRVRSGNKVVALRQQRAQPDHLFLHEQGLPLSVQ